MRLNRKRRAEKARRRIPGVLEIDDSRRHWLSPSSPGTKRARASGSGQATHVAATSTGRGVFSAAAEPTADAGPPRDRGRNRSFAHVINKYSGGQDKSVASVIGAALSVTYEREAAPRTRRAPDDWRARRRAECTFLSHIVVLNAMCPGLVYGWRGQRVVTSASIHGRCALNRCRRGYVVDTAGCAKLNVGLASLTSTSAFSSSPHILNAVGTALTGSSLDAACDAREGARSPRGYDSYLKYGRDRG